MRPISLSLLAAAALASQLVGVLAQSSSQTDDTGTIINGSPASSDSNTQTDRTSSTASASSSNSLALTGTATTTESANFESPVYSPTSQIRVTTRSTTNTDTRSSTGSGSGTSSSTSSNTNSNSHSNSTVTTSTGRTTTQTITTITGGDSSTSTRTTGSSTSSTSTGPVPSNTVPCNNYPEFCSRQYSNITQICAHNSYFSVKNNAASNQDYDMHTQLDDGIRMIQGETQLVNGTMYGCHTSCDLLNAGTYASILSRVANWVERHPYDVVTILVGNSDYEKGVTAKDYVKPFEESGLMPYLYEPEYVPQRRNQWPTLGEMILSGKRVVAFIDYNANQTAVPWLLDEYTHFWSTPFSPTDPDFPCSLQLPLHLDNETAKEEFMYIANHNLNVRFNLGGYNILIPDTYHIQRTNGKYDQFGQLGAMTGNCSEIWNAPPNFLVVDYYNRGDPKPGSVFEVAAKANNVTYNRECCGNGNGGDGSTGTVSATMSMLVCTVAFSLFLYLVSS
ncbi:PLC-like phosphodiesterase [Hortaea werneckii]|uniref:PLC-like phosphodiesterase n=1 Tax=Hortaea werneckii TaxID=91943 RepID=A0A3M7GFS3_HORWE|nr:PLC-like phosphodiesterase [Hortaea werneckii]KAI7572794.1 PLC-like phosphodiesterase [Hortaea werneckii]KAI7628078.1 PLC-like phosphodiesterase [Hortaea werneckii]KAI7638007.1 PLC-like phosphodiesterase [Hortaea werneckii]KAI7683556.1 PLC-like phosphodiesterase [Hortaea werneckii]